MARTGQARAPAGWLVLLGCLGLVSGPAAEIRVTGSDLLGPDFARAVAVFSRQNDMAVKLELRGTRPGMEELKAGRADVGLFLLPPGENPPAEGLTSRVIGYQVAVVAVPAASPLTQATTAQLRGIFGGASGDAFSRWGDLNLIGSWTSRPIALRALAPSAGLAWPLFAQVILTGAAARPAVEFAATPGEFVQRLLAAENSIGVTGLPAGEVPGLRVLALAAGPAEPAIGPTPEQVHRGDYPLRLPLHVTFRRGDAAKLQLFLQFLLSDEAAAALAPASFLPLPPGDRHRLGFELEGMR
jgi:ABC-type phosphate transport system substrate-binding protein